MTNAERRELLTLTKQAQSRGFQGSVLDVLQNPATLQEFSNQIQDQQKAQPRDIDTMSSPEQQQQGLQALQEGDPRNLAAGVGRVGALAANQGEKTRIAMGEALYQNNKMKADAKQNVNQQLIDINLGAAADQSMMARDARRAESQGMQQAVDGLGAVAGAASDLVKPFSMSKADRRASKLLGPISAADKSKLNLQGLDDTAIIAILSQIPNIEKLTRAELNIIMEQIKNEQFDFDFDLNKVFKPVSSVSSVSSSGVVPVSSGTGISAPVYTG